MSTAKGAQSAIPFPQLPSIHDPSSPKPSNMSLISVRTTSLDVCEYVYGESRASMDAIGRYYEPNASELSFIFPIYPSSDYHLQCEFNLIFITESRS